MRWNTPEDRAPLVRSQVFNGCKAITVDYYDDLYGSVDPRLTEDKVKAIREKIRNRRYHLR